MLDRNFRAFLALRLERLLYIWFTNFQPLESQGECHLSFLHCIDLLKAVILQSLYSWVQPWDILPVVSQISFDRSLQGNSHFLVKPELPYVPFTASQRVLMEWRTVFLTHFHISHFHIIPLPFETLYLGLSGPPLLFMFLKAYLKCFFFLFFFLYYWTYGKVFI